MFSELTGTIKKIHHDSITLNINNVGYLVQLSDNVLNKLTINQNSSLLIETKFKVDKIVLFGFMNEYQQFLFNKIGNISGVSDKIALNLSGFFEPQEIIHILNGEDKENPFKINGLGAKTWEKIIFNLARDKSFTKECYEFSLKSNVEGSDSKEFSISIQMLNNKNEAISALVNIGIGKNLASDLIEKVIKEKSLEEATTENLVKAALSRHYS
jgi:Holliday junction DNA helicase RuvA subunit